MVVVISHDYAFPGMYIIYIICIFAMYMDVFDYQSMCSRSGECLREVIFTLHLMLYKLPKDVRT